MQQKIVINFKNFDPSTMSIEQCVWELAEQMEPNPFAAALHPPVEIHFMSFIKRLKDVNDNVAKEMLESLMVLSSTEMVTIED